MPPKLSFLAQRHERDMSPAFCDTQPAGIWSAGWLTHPTWLRFDTRTQVATVETQGTSVDIMLKSHTGLMIEPWDLHVGAVIDVCGRSVTLVGSDQAVCSSPSSVPADVIIFWSAFLHCVQMGQRDMLHVRMQSAACTACMCR